MVNVISTGSESVNTGKETSKMSLGKKGIIASSIIAISGIAMATLGKIPESANAQTPTTTAESSDGSYKTAEMDVKTTDGKRVRVDLGDTQVKSTPVAYTPTPDTLNALTPDAIFSDVEGIIKDNYEGREQQKWLYINGRLRQDNIVGINLDDFVEFANADNGLVRDRFLNLPSEGFTNLHKLVNSSKLAADAEYTNKLADSLTRRTN